MIKDSPLVSIVTPAYNAEKFIAETIESVLNQSFKEWELLVIDDGSTDDTANIVKSFSDDRITLIQQKNGGVSSARNKGLDLAKGKYITFLDADDVLPLNSLKSRVEYLENNPGVALVDGQITVKDKMMKNDVRVYEPYYEGQLLPRLMALDSRVFFNVCYMFKREILNNVRFKEKMTHAEDLLFYIELSSFEPLEYGFIQEEIYWYRSGHLSAMRSLQGLEDGYIALIDKVKKLENISKMSFYSLKLKIVKIMFLSWFSKKEFNKALGTMYKILKV